MVEDAREEMIAVLTFRRTAFRSWLLSMSIEIERELGECSLTRIFSHLLQVLHQRLETGLLALVMFGPAISAFKDSQPLVKVVQ